MEARTSGLPDLRQGLKMKILRPYQVNAVRYLRARQHGALFMEMRLGKTLTLIRYIKQLPETRRCLVAAPYSALAGWAEELAAERQPAPVYLTGTKAERYNQLIKGVVTAANQPRTWFLINKEGHLTLPEIAGTQWDVVIIDESFIRNPKAKVTKFFMKNFRDVKHRYILSGTPAPEGELDYFCQLQFLDPAILNVKDYWHFRLNWFSQFGYDYMIKPAARKVLSQRLAATCFFLRRKDVNLGGEKIYEKRVVELPTELRKAYDRLEHEFILEIQGIERETLYAGVKFGLLRQLCGGFAEKRLVGNHKVAALAELLDGELKDQQVIVWAWYIHEVEHLAQVLKCKSIYGKTKLPDREKIRGAFQRGEERLLVAQPEVWKFGTTLSAASTMIYYSSPEALLTRQQSEDRTLDLAANNSALIIDLLCKDTVDEDIRESLLRKEDKDTMMRSLINAIRRRTIH